MPETSRISVFDQNSKRDLLCVSHLRWDFVYQRPQHLLSRAARNRRVIFFEEPVFEAVASPQLRTRDRSGVLVATPILPNGTADPVVTQTVGDLLAGIVQEHQFSDYVLWYYTPMAMAITGGLQPAVVVYDCMDELSMFKGAPPELREREAELFRQADLVFTGGRSLYEVKRAQHPAVYAFPSSIDKTHFEKARDWSGPEPRDQASIPHPRLGFFGVIDERLDRDLLRQAAAARPEWQFIMLGPVVKIDPADLPQSPNIHYLGAKEYAELPAYIAGWDVALLLFALNDSTRFISPTKTPEYLAAGRPVVSTAITDVVCPYGHMELVRIATDITSFLAAVEAALAPAERGWLARVDEFLADQSWDQTWHDMERLLDGVAGTVVEEDAEILKTA